MVEPHPEDEPIRQRIVVLGASNVANAVPLIANAFASDHGLPRTDLCILGGHGRSYGQPSTLLGLRTLPGLRESPFWNVARGFPPAERQAALLTDIGNDLTYGRDGACLGGWVAEVGERLMSLGYELAVLPPDAAGLGDISERRFRFYRRLFFPGSQLTVETVRRELPIALDLVRDRFPAARWIDARPDWFGFDPIHIRRSRRAAAWQAIFGDLPAVRPPERFPAVWPWQRLSWYRRAKPASYLWRGAPRTTTQPVVRLPRLSISFY